MNKYLYYWTWNLFIILLLYVWMKHPGHTYGGFVPAISEQGMTLRYQIGAFQGMTKWSWPNVKIIVTTGVHLTCGPSGPDPRPSGPRGRPTDPSPWPVSQGLRRYGLSLGCHASTWGGEAWVSGGPIHPYKYPSRWKSTHHTHFVVLHL
jgi:hypothetical protein